MFITEFTTLEAILWIAIGLICFFWAIRDDKRK